MKKILSIILSLITVISVFTMTSTAYAASKPAAPKGVTTKVVSYSQVKVSWKKVSKAKGYYVRYATSKNGKYKSLKVGSSAASKTVTGLSPNTKYYFKVAAYNKAGTGKNSSIVSRTTTTRALAQKQQTNSQKTTFNFSESKYVFIQSNAIYYASSMGATNHKVLTLEKGHAYGDLAIKGNYIYYVDHTEGWLYRIKFDGTNKSYVTWVSDSYEDLNYSLSYIIYGDYIYFVESKYEYFDSEPYFKDSYKLYRCKLDGKSRTYMTTVSSRFIYAYNGALYYTKGSKLGYYKKGTYYTKSLSKSLTGCEFCGMDYSKIYFTKNKQDNYSSKIQLYYVDTKNFKVTSAKTIPVLDPIHDMIAYKNNAYISTGTGAGNGFGVVSTSNKANYNSYYSKYHMLIDGGNCLGFYKNYVCGIDLPDYENFNKTKIVKLAKCG